MANEVLVAIPTSLLMAMIWLMWRAMNRQFEQMERQMEKRFEQMEKRFEQIDKRFEGVDRRFDRLELKIDTLFERYADSDKRLTVVELGRRP